jgi:hypothetical protein
VTAISDRHYEDKDREQVAIRLRFVGEAAEEELSIRQFHIAVGGPAVTVIGGVAYYSVRAVH